MSPAILGTLLTPSLGGWVAAVEADLAIFETSGGAVEWPCGGYGEGAWGLGGLDVAGASTVNKEGLLRGDGDQGGRELHFEWLRLAVEG